MLKRLYQSTSGKQAILFGIVFVLFTATILPWIATLTTEVIGVSDSPDTGFQFNLTHLYDLLQSYGVAGRRFYILMRWTFDVVWPLVYTCFLVSVIAYFGRNTSCRFGHRVLYVPILAMTFDFLENINATIVMAIYPTRLDLFGYLLFGSSILKWSILSLAFLLAIGLGVRLLIQTTISNKRP